MYNIHRQYIYIIYQIYLSAVFKLPLPMNAFLKGWTFCWPPSLDITSSCQSENNMACSTPNFFGSAFQHQIF